MNTILIVDDDEGVRAFAAGGLVQAGFVIHQASDGATGVELAKSKHPDLVLCDIEMPGMDGYETLKVLRNDPATAGIQFVFLSGIADRADVRFGMELGADDYLTKPFSLEELVDNAFKFSKPGTRVDVISGLDAGGRYRFGVKDLGRGMSAAQAASIGAHMQFDRRMYEQQGFRLGLTLAKKLAELHGGELHIASEPNCGTEISLLLPSA